MTTRIGLKAAAVASAALFTFAMLLAFAPRASAEVKKFPAAGTMVWSSVAARKTPSTSARRVMLVNQMRVDGRPQIVHAIAKQRIGAVTEGTASATLKNAAGADALRLVARVSGASANRYRVTIEDREGTDRFVVHDGAAPVVDFEYTETSVAELANLINTYSTPIVATLLADGTPLRPVAGAAVTGGVDGREGVLWYKLNLPLKPYGQTGWVPAESVTLKTMTKIIIVHRRAKFLEVRSNGRRVFRARIATGRADRPTPLGNFYVAAKYRPPTNAFVSAYALELSVPAGLPDFLKGGVVGIHGTPATNTIGKNASNGCIRVHNSTVLRLKSLVPLGTPVKIVR